MGGGRWSEGGGREVVIQTTHRGRSLTALDDVQRRLGILQNTVHDFLGVASRPDEVQQRQQLLKKKKNKQYSGMTDMRLNSFFHDCHHQNCEYVNILKQMEQDLGTAVLAAQVAAIHPRKNLLPGLSKCPFPIHLVSGEQDNLVSEAIMFTMNKLLPNSDMTLIKKAGHMLPIEQSRALAKYLASKIG